MLKALLIQIIKPGVLILVIAVSVMLTHRIGPIPTVAAVCLGMGIICATVAILLRRVPMRKVTLVNYAAGIFLPFGYFIGKGKLLPIVITSWIVWSIAAAVSAFAAAKGYDPRVVASDGQRHVTSTLVLLVIFWIIDGFAILYLSRTIATRLNIRSAAARQLFLMICLLVAMIAVSAVLWSYGFGVLAVLIAGGPISFVGGSYGLYLAVVLITKPRWN
jgi:hypothetical protein